MDQAMEAQAQEAPQQGADVFTVEGARAKMQMPEEMRAAYVRIVEAGMKLMFDPQTREGTIAALEEPGDMAQKLAQAVTAVMALLFKESNGTLPPQLIIPCGVELLLHVVAVANKGGMGIDNNTVAEAMANMIEAVMKQFGVDPGAGGMVTDGAAAEQQPAAKSAGLIQGAMQ